MAIAKEDISALIKDKYYGPLLYSYVDTILCSGELLEDDFQVILSVYRIDEFCINEETTLPYSLLVSAFSLFPSLIALKKMGCPLLMVPSLVITTSLTCCKIHEIKTKRRHKILIHNLVVILKQIQGVYKKINQYLIERKKNSSERSRELFQPFTNAIINFMKILHKQHCEIQHKITSVIFDVSTFCEPLKEDCSMLESYNLAAVEDLYLKEFEGYLKYTDHIISFQQLVTSKLLSYIAIIFSWEESTINKTTVKELLNLKLPSLIKFLNEYYKKTSKLFESLRNSAARFSSRDFEKRTTKNCIPRKLRNALDTSVNNLSFVLEKLNNIIDIIEESDGNVNLKIDEALADLRDNTLGTYETLDILCKIHGILLDSKVNSEQQNTSTAAEEITSYLNKNNDDSQPLNMKNPSDLIEDREKYELYIKATDRIEEPIINYGEQSDAYLQIMIKELKKNLRQHNFYVSAKKRWKDDSDDNCSSNSDDEHLYRESTITRKNIPDDSSGFSSTRTTTNTNNPLERKSQLKSESNKILGISEVDVQDLERTSENEIHKSDTSTRLMQVEEQKSWNPILQGIRAASYNFQVDEETFGEDEDSD